MSDKVTLQVIKNVDDAGRVARVHHVSRKAAYEKILPESYVNEKPFSQREMEWAEEVAKAVGGNSYVWLAQVGIFDAGCASAGAARDEDLDAGVVGELYKIYVLPQYWSKGIGKLLFDHACSQMRMANRKEMAVWVYEANERGRLFYERQGMKLTPARRTPKSDASVGVVRYKMPL
jgi:GNAT superfamily N-acetyltransferase